MTSTGQHAQRREGLVPKSVAREIVVGVDGKDAALPAVRWAAAEARRRGARLVLATVDHWAGDTMPTAAERVATRARLVVAAELTRSAAPATEVEVEVTSELLEGLPGPALVQRAAAALLLVVGVPAPEPHGGPRSSVPSYCATHARCPTVIVPYEDPTPGS